MPQRQIDGHLAAVAAADHDGGRGVQGGQQRGRVIRVLPDAGEAVRLGTFAATAPAPVEKDQPTPAGQFSNSTFPEHG